MAYPSTALASSPSTHGDVAADVRALGQYGMPVFNVVTGYGATGDGTTNDTTAVNNAITAANAAGGVVWFPPGTYDVANVTWKAGVVYAGVRGKSILTIRTGASYLGSCDSGSSSAFISNMTFRGLTFRGRIDTDTTFDQFRHLLNLNGVSDVLILDCDFIGWHGDAIYLGSSNTGSTERHNKRVKILGCFFDGLTKNNRNCVSIIDGEDILVQGCTARRFSRNDMPGFVDVEPNAGTASFAIVRNVRVIGNSAEDHNQNFFQLNIPAALTNNACDFVVANNIDNASQSNTNTRFAFLSYARSAISDTSLRQNVVIANNVCRNSGWPVELQGGIAGVQMIGNTFEDIWGGAVLGTWNNGCRFIAWDANNFVRCGYGESGYVFKVAWVQAMQIRHNTFHDCGLTAGGGTVVRFDQSGGSGGDLNPTSDRIDYVSNAIYGSKLTSISSKHASHTISAAANNIRQPYRENSLSFDTSHFGTLV